MFRALPMRSLTLIAACLFLLAIPKRADADLFLTNAAGNRIGEYDSSTGAAVSASLITGLNVPVGVTVSSSGILYVANFSAGTVGE